MAEELDLFAGDQSNLDLFQDQDLFAGQATAKPFEMTPEAYQRPGMKTEQPVYVPPSRFGKGGYVLPSERDAETKGLAKGAAGALAGGTVTGLVNLVPNLLYNYPVAIGETIAPKIAELSGDKETADRILGSKLPRIPTLPSSTDIAQTMFGPPATSREAATREIGGTFGEVITGGTAAKLLGLGAKGLGFLYKGGKSVLENALGRPLTSAQENLLDKMKTLGEGRVSELSAEERSTLKSLEDEAARKATAEKAAAKAKGAEERAVGGLAGTKEVEEFGQYGIVPMTKTKIGENLRTMVDNFVSSIKEVRKTKADAEFPAAFKTAAAREAAGESFVNSPGMKAVKKAIDDRLKTTTDRTLANNLEKLRDALFVGRTETSMTPTVGVRPTAMFPAEKTTKVVAAPTFKSAEDIRRFLGDAASGVTAEGYEAIGQNLARDLYGQLSEAMKSFSPEFGSYLQRYKDLSSQIESAGTKLGKALIGVEKDAPGYYAVDASKVADRAFSSPESISTLIDAMGGNKQPVMAMAERYFANELAGKTTEQARKFLTSDKVRSLLNELGPEFRSRIETGYFTKASQQSKIAEMAQSVAAESETKISNLTKNLEGLQANKKTIADGIERINQAIAPADQQRAATELLANLKSELPAEAYAEAENIVTQVKEAVAKQKQAQSLIWKGLAGLGVAGGLGTTAYKASKFGGQ